MFKLAAEKNLNKYLFPIFSIKGRPVNYPVKVKYVDREVFCTQGMFDAKSWMMMDILGTYIIQRLYNRNEDKAKVEFRHKIPTQSDSRVKRNSGTCISYKLLKHVIPLMIGVRNEIPNYLPEPRAFSKQIDGVHDRIKKIMCVPISDSFIKRQAPIMKDYSSAQIYQLLKKIEDFKLHMNYSIHYWDGKNYQNLPFSTYKYPYSFFHLTDVKNVRIASNGNILERAYFICFDTILGHYFVQNCISCYVDLLPEKFYEMTDTAQLLYRMLILPYFGGKKIPLHLNEIRKRLILKTPDTYMVRKLIRRAFDELASYGFIKSPREEKEYGEYLYYFEKCSWEEIQNATIAEGYAFK